MGNYHRKGYLMLHHLADAAIQIANLVNYIPSFKKDGNKIYDQNKFYALVS